MTPITTHGLHMDKLGLGTWKMSGPDCTDAIGRALEAGYRHIDTAAMYANEAEIGDALAATSVPRADLHVTTKVWWENLAPDALRRSFDASQEKLKLDYVDLFLIHWPHPGMDLPAALETMMALKQEGRVRNIGVSNFTVALMREAVERIGAPIACNQIEYHILLDQSKVLAYAAAHDIAVTAYCPLARGGLDRFPALAAIAARHGVTAEQVALKWLLDQPGVAAIPKASQPANQRANLAARAIALDDDDRRAIAALPKDQRLVAPAFMPAWD
jgi:2,5-diketo-D-gluconate reductase B